MEWLLSIKDWFMGLGEKYHVNPIVFGSIYVGAIPFFFASLAWLIKNIKQKKPVMLTGFFFISAYLYLIIVGRNIPLWVYFFIALLVGYGIYSTYKTVRKKIQETIH